MEGLKRKIRDFAIVFDNFIFVLIIFWRDFCSHFLKEKTRTMKKMVKERVNIAIAIERDNKSSSLISNHLLYHKYKNNQERCS